MKFISGLFGGSKKDGGFFLQLKDEPDEPMPKADSKPVEASNNGKKPADAKAQTDKTAKPANATAQTNTKLKSKDTAKVTIEDNRKKEVASDKVKVKDKDNNVKDVASDKVQEVDVEMVQTAKGVEAKAVTVEKKEAQKKAAKKAVKTDKPEDDKETLFAPKYLIPKNDGMRRRPGANMNSFLDMASKVKAPIKK
ncbi:hypothetical protein [Calothrix sp. CCY 0018]|uniref:hypothetical protein n=1 Tax=Calothrix sp. CCY 0018 TaxID=3103864 RepID=UPI0039C65612